MKAFHDNYNLTSLIKQPTCYEKPNNPTCIDLILSNTPSSFQSTCVTETRYYQVSFNDLTVMKRASENSNSNLRIIAPTKTSQKRY